MCFRKSSLPTKERHGQMYWRRVSRGWVSLQAELRGQHLWQPTGAGIHLSSAEFIVGNLGVANSWRETTSSSFAGSCQHSRMSLTQSSLCLSLGLLRSRPTPGTMHRLSWLGTSVTWRKKELFPLRRAGSLQSSLVWAQHLCMCVFTWDCDIKGVLWLWIMCMCALCILFYICVMCI